MLSLSSFIFPHFFFLSFFYFSSFFISFLLFIILFDFFSVGLPLCFIPSSFFSPFLFSCHLSCHTCIFRFTLFLLLCFPCHSFLVFSALFIFVILFFACYFSQSVSVLFSPLSQFPLLPLYSVLFCCSFLRQLFFLLPLLTSHFYPFSSPRLLILFSFSHPFFVSSFF